MPVIATARPGGESPGPVDWNALKREVLAKLNVVEEYQALGVKFTGKSTSIKGFKECHAIGREDQVPSAAVNVLSWVYTDSGSPGKALGFFDFAMKYGDFGNWYTCVKFYADKAGVPIGEVRRSSHGRIVEEVYRYQTAAGDTSYGVFRYREPNGKKTFRQFRFERGTWVREQGAMEGVRPLPYRLPELLSSDPDEPVLVVEGEKDVDRLCSLGMVATTNHQGASSTDATWPAFAGLLPRRNYYIVPDNDGPGREHARRVCRYLVTRAESIRLLVIPDLVPGGDVSDWLDAGGTVEHLGQLMHAAPVWTPETAEVVEKVLEPAQEKETEEQDDLDRDATAADLIRINTMIRWTWENWVPLGVLTILASEPGKGKTRLCADWLRRVNLGLPWPDGAPNTLPVGSKAIWVPADNQHPEIGSFPGAFGFDPEALVLNASKRNPFLGTMLDSPEDLADFEARILRVRPVFVFIDTCLNATDRTSTKPEDAKAFFKPLQEIAARTQTSIVCVTHTNDAGKPLGRRIVGQGRVVIQLSEPDPGQPDRRKLWVSKSNSLPPRALGITMGSGGNEYDFSPPEPPPESANDKGGGSGKDTPKRLKECADWLVGILETGPTQVMTIRTQMEDTDFNVNLLYRTFRHLKLIEYETEGRKWWRLASEESPF